MSKKNIEDSVRDSLEGYFDDLRGEEPHGLHDMLTRMVERPLLEVVMARADNNQSRAAESVSYTHLTLPTILLV